MEKVKVTGGARIGAANATWPFASLTVTKDKLQLNATIIGNLIFKPDDIVSIELYRINGIKINHKVPEYKDRVVFWTFSNSTNLIKKIEQTGFLTNTDPIDTKFAQKVEAYQSKGGFPIKTSAAIAIVLIWNIFFLIDIQNYFGGDNDTSPLGIGAQLGMGFVLLICVLLFTFEPVRKLILKEGRTVEDIKTFLFFLMFICGFMLLMITLIP